jgi:hypothetical protein
VIIFVRGGYRKKSVVHESSGTPCGDVCHRIIVGFYTKKNKVHILIRKIINNMNSYKKLCIILMNISTMLKISLQVHVYSTAEYQPQKL